MTTTPRRPRAVVVGATFGTVYAEALATPDSPVELVGLVSSGSAESRQLAARLQIPQYTGLDDLPSVDVAFVVVRSSVVGGQGERLANQLLARGIDVLQEQPVHADEMLPLARAAKESSARYAVNDFYSRVAPMRRFIGAARALDARSPIRYLHARSAIHVAYPLFAILGAIVGPLTPARLTAPEHTEGAFAAGRMVLGDVTVDLLIQNELCPQDPDNHARLLHAITVGSDCGELVLEHTHGPTRWHPRPRAGGGAMEVRIAQPVGADVEPTAAQVRNELWPDAIRSAAAEFVDQKISVSQRFLRTSRLWSEFTSAIGPAALIDPQPPAEISAAELAAP